MFPLLMQGREEERKKEERLKISEVHQVAEQADGRILQAG